MPQTPYTDQQHRAILQQIAHKAMLDRSLLPDFSTAVLAGAGAMLLPAPQSDKKTRAKIERKGWKLGKQTTKTIDAGVDQVRAKAHEVTSSIQEQVEDLQQRGQDVVDGQRERWAPVVKAGKTAVNKA
jgi:gas vesicle protein